MTQAAVPQSRLFGYLAEFDTPEALIEATRKTHEAGYTLVDAYSPMPVDELEEALGLPPTRIPLLVFIGGTLGALTGFGMCWYANVLSYPWNIGGRPFNSWPAWIPITFELTVLFSAFFAAFGMLARNGLPQPYHPVFNVDRFDLASQNRFFLIIESRDLKFQAEITREFLQSLNAHAVTEVPK